MTPIMTKEKGRKIAVVQAGGPTAVLNCSLYGLLKSIGRRDRCAEIVGVRNGVAGLVAGDWFVIDGERNLDWLKQVPGAALGSGRKPITEDELERIVRRLKQADIRTLVMLGGNGTMWVCGRLSGKAEELGCDLQVIGIPKTVDNDLMEVDHTPGFPSAAKFVAHAVRDISIDLAAMANFEQVRVIETMGRNAGWLTAAASYFKRRAEDAPHLVYVPESNFSMDHMLSEAADIQARLGYCVIVVSEGIRGEDGQPLSMKGISQGTQSPARALGGAGALLADAVSKRLGLNCRYDNLGILQRCSSFAVSETDRLEAEALGERAASLIFNGERNKMVGIRRLSDEPYEWTISEIDFKLVGGRERPLDARYVRKPGLIDPSYQRWLSPFIGEATNPYML